MRIFIIFLWTLCFSAFADVTDNKDVQSFMQDMAVHYHFNHDALEKLFAATTFNDRIITLMNKPYEAKPWYQYKKLFVTPARISDGQAFLKQHQALLLAIQNSFHVNANVIVATVGIETNYGRTLGGFNVFNTLSTLAFNYPKRATFFKNELKEYLLMTREQGLNPLDLQGSYAGAMGYGQFMPSSYRAYAIDYRGHHHADLVRNVEDALASTANYYQHHGWVLNKPIFVRAHVHANPDGFISAYHANYPLAYLKKQGITPVSGHYDMSEKASLIKLAGETGPEYYLAFNNFYVIKRYNPSDQYAMAIASLANAITHKG